LITVAQAIHWFDFDAFYKEADRIIKNKGILIHAALKKAWGSNTTRAGYFPILLRVATINQAQAPSIP
jgi:hypothetical protein